MTGVRDILNALGFDMGPYHQESSNPAILVETKTIGDVAPDATTGAELVFALSGVSKACKETDTVLQIAKGAGPRIPPTCNFGLCGTCKVRKTADEVKVTHNGGISDTAAGGYILVCCPHPIGRVEVEA